MRQQNVWKLVLLAGVVSVSVGFVFVSFPFVSQGGQAVSLGYVPDAGEVLENVGGFSITGVTPVAISWTSANGTAVSVGAAACQSPCEYYGIPFRSQGNYHEPFVWENGSSGSFNVNTPNGWEVDLLVSDTDIPTNVTFTMVTALNSVGTVLTVAGGVALIAGVALWKRWKASPP